MKTLPKLCLAISSLVFSMSALSGSKSITETLEQVIPGLSISSIEKTAMDGIFQVETTSGETLFTSEDASYFITGDLYSIKNKKIVNLSEEKRETDRASIINAIPDAQKVVFPAVDEVKGRIAVFTDIDCGYCRKLHNEVPELNKMGIEVSYLAYPRAGVNSESYKKYVSAWCAEDKLTAMTRAKNGQSIKQADCENPVTSQFNLGRSIGISGTPAIILESGTLIPGYINAQKIAQALGVN